MLSREDRYDQIYGFRKVGVEEITEVAEARGRQNSETAVFKTYGENNEEMVRMGEWGIIIGCMKNFRKQN